MSVAVAFQFGLTLRGWSTKMAHRAGKAAPGVIIGQIVARASPCRRPRVELRSRVEPTPGGARVHEWESSGGCFV